ncbi:hypothetical protein BH23ACT11_BH23ACT11_06690 [soil metagenome]
MKFARSVKVLLYAAFIGVLLASYVTPLQEIIDRRAEIPVMEEKIDETTAYNAEQRRLAKSLNTPAGIERAAREDYGMIRAGEKIYLIPEAGE